MSKLLAFRAPDALAQAILDLVAKSGKTQTEVIIDALTNWVDLPPASLSPVEERLGALEIQMSVINDKLDTIAAGSDDIDRSKQTPEFSKTLAAKGTLISPKDKVFPEFDRYVIPILKTYLSGGYYFRSEWLGEPELKVIIQAQAKELGFKSESIKIDRKVTRVWLNREYHITSV